MAGRPQRREREAAAAADDGIEIPEAKPRAGANGHARNGRPAARERAPARQKPGAGPATRRAGDEAQANAAAMFAGQLAPGLAVRIERIKPSWCAGWLEDFVLDEGELGELLEYLQEEYGGKTYRVTALAAGGQPLWNSKINIAGPPLRDGHPVTRWEWEGLPNPQQNPAPLPAEGGGVDMSAFMQLLGMVMTSSEKSSSAQLAAIKEAVTASKDSNSELMQLIVQDRGDTARTSSFGGQLQTLVESSEALREAGQYFGAAEGRADNPGPGGAGQVAMDHFLQNVLKSEFPGGGKPAAAAAAKGETPPKTKRRVVVKQRRTPRAPQTGDIPESVARTK